MMAKTMVFRPSLGFMLAPPSNKSYPEMFEVGEIEAAQKNKELFVKKWRWVTRSKSGTLYITARHYANEEEWERCMQHTPGDNFGNAQLLQPILSTEIEEKATIYV